MATFDWIDEKPQVPPPPKKTKREALLHEQIRIASIEKNDLEARVRKQEITLIEHEGRSRAYHDEQVAIHRRDVNDINRQLVREEATSDQLRAQLTSEQEKTKQLGVRLKEQRRIRDDMEAKHMDMWSTELENNFTYEETIKKMQARLDEDAFKIRSMERVDADRVRKQKQVMAAAKKTDGVLGDPHQYNVLTASTPWCALHLKREISEELCDRAMVEKSSLVMFDIDPDDKLDNRKQSSHLPPYLGPKTNPATYSILCIIMHAFSLLGYAHIRTCTFFCGGSRQQLQHCDEGLDDSFSIIVALTYREIFIFFTDGRPIMSLTHNTNPIPKHNPNRRPDPQQKIILNKGDVLIFNTLVTHAGTINDPSSTGLFIYIDREYDSKRKKGYNWMAADEQEWNERILPEEIAKHEKRGDGTQVILHPLSMAEVPFVIYQNMVVTDVNALMARYSRFQNTTVKK